jgi:hypothetical protein
MASDKRPARSNGRKRTALLVLLSVHFIGIALLIGASVAGVLIDQQTSHGTLEVLALGRDVGSFVVRGLALPGFLITAASGITMTLLRYGRRPPVWVWTKISLNLGALAISASFVAPALIAARQWAGWSVDHGTFAPELQQSATQAAIFSAVIVGMFLVNIPVAVWKPFASVRLPRPRVHDARGLQS